MNNLPIFDGHNDTLLSLLYSGRTFFEESSSGHIDLPRAKRSGFGGGFFAVFTPNEQYKMVTKETKDGYETPLPPPITQEYALQTSLAMIAELFKIESQSDGGLKVVTAAQELERCLLNDTMAAVLHIEGAEAIDRDFNALHVLYQAGLRSLGLVWSRPNAYGHGVPFRYPSSPDTGPGLTDRGKDLVKECNSLGIMVDTAHLTEKGFWDVAGITNVPLVASHSCVHAICPMSRNLTDKQISAIAESGGVVGINYSVNMLREDGGRDPNTSMDEIVKHIDYIVEHFGIDYVALGSDFDGTTIPAEMKDVTGMPILIEKLKQRGYSYDHLKKIAWENWVRVLHQTWKE
ncbi:dipeptidase [Peribacillus kribbensis]|uniref:dipeptidase n=1 Tax=Peribacillus kribbensis TaxID=356658 RepID=UPI00040464CC|nr:dipeptidase [Peribacillus kribbensis]